MKINSMFLNGTAFFYHITILHGVSKSFLKRRLFLITTISSRFYSVSFHIVIVVENKHIIKRRTLLEIVDNKVDYVFETIIIPSVIIGLKFVLH